MPRPLPYNENYFVTCELLRFLSRNTWRSSAFKHHQLKHRPEKRQRREAGQRQAHINQRPPLGISNQLIRGNLSMVLDYCPRVTNQSEFEWRRRKGRKNLIKLHFFSTRSTEINYILCLFCLPLVNIFN